MQSTQIFIQYLEYKSRLMRAKFSPIESFEEFRRQYVKQYGLK
jgi:hypothetical protein